MDMNFFEKPKLVKLRMDLIREEVQELEDAVEEKDYKETIDALGDIVYVCYGMAVSMGIDLHQAFKIIHESNMSKLCKTEEQAIRSVQYYKEEKADVYPTPAYRKSKDGQNPMIPRPMNTKQ